MEAIKDAATVAGIPIIQKAFSDQDEQVRLHAALMLRKIGHRSGVPLLGQVVLSDNSTAVRAAGPRTGIDRRQGARSPGNTGQGPQ